MKSLARVDWQHNVLNTLNANIFVFVAWKLLKINFSIKLIQFVAKFEVLIAFL